VPLAGIYGLTALGVLVALFAPLEIGFSAVLGAWMLIPAGLILPGALHVFLVDRVILGAFALRLALRYGRPGEPTASAYRLTPLHGAWGALLVVGYVDGALLSSSSLHDNLTVWLTLFDCSVLLVAALAVLRTVGVWRVLRPLTAVVGIAIGIGIIERISGHGWAAYLSEHVPAAFQSTFIFPLATRGGHVRPQAASEFALEYGWVLAILLPLLVMAVGLWIDRNRRWGARRQLLLLVPIGAAVAVVLSASRSAEVAVAAGAVLLVVAAGAPRRITAAVGAATVIVLVILALAPSVVLNPFRTASANSISSRLVRLHVVLNLVVHHAFVGLGYTGTHSVLVGLDDAYAQTYTQLGVIGLLAWLAVLLASLAVALRTLRAPRGSPLRQLGAACVIGIVAVAVASGGYDLTFTEQSMWALVLLGALAVYLAEQLPARPVRARSPIRALLPMMGAGAGALVLALAPVGWSRSYTLYLISPKELATQQAVQFGWIAGELAPTTCGYLDALPLRAGTELNCAQPSIYENSAWPAQVTMSIAGSSASAVNAETRRALRVFQLDHYPLVAADGPMESGKPSWAVTAPVSGAFAGLMVGLIVPPLRRRRTSAAVAAMTPAFVT